MSDRLSSELLFQADVIEREMLEDRTPEERRDYVKHQLLVERIVAVLISSRETITNLDLSAFESFVRADRDLAEDLLDSHYALSGLRETGSIVDRTLRLAQLQASTIPSAQTNQYIREAAKTYIAGFSMASVAMSRAALEQAMKERLRKNGHKISKYIGFESLVDVARNEGFLSKIGSDAAKEIGRKGNSLLHQKPTDDAEAFEVLIKTRSLLEEIYSASGTTPSSTPPL